MAINQVSSGALQSVNMVYGQNQANPSPAIQKNADNADPAEAAKGVTVNISQESLRLSQKAKVQGVEKEVQLQNMDKQPAQKTDGSGQANGGTATRSQEKLDLYA